METANRKTCNLTFGRLLSLSDMSLNEKRCHDNKALFERLDLEYSGLEKVNDAVEAGNIAAVEVAYLDYHRARIQPKLDWHFGEGEDFERNTSMFDFLTEHPKVITWKDRGKVKPLISRAKGYTHTRTQGLMASDYTVVDLADLVLENKIFLPYSPEDGVQDLGQDWNWEHVPPASGTGRRWTLSLPYQYYFRALAQTYWLTGEEKYIAKLVQIATHYVRYVNHRSDWIWIPDMQLTVNYLQMLPFILSWENLDANDFCAMYGWLVDGCATSMEAGEGAQGNQLLYGGLGFLWLGVGMPECKCASHWRRRGLNQIGQYFGETAAYPDGSSKENSYGYVIGASTNGAKGLRLARENGYPVPDHLHRALVKRAEFLAYIAKPDGSCVWTGDGQRGFPFNFVRSVTGLEKSRDMEYIASGGERGTPPSRRSVYFPYGGVGVMCSDWSREANYLFFDVGPLGVLHAHEGKLAVEVVAYGRSLMEDLGIHSYSREAHELPWYRFFGHTVGHNSAIVDGLSQMRLVTGPYTTDGPLDNPWWSTPVCDYLAGSYEEGYGTGHYAEPMSSVFAPDPWQGEINHSVQHHRSVLFVKAREPGDYSYWMVTDRFTGNGRHTYESLFHFVPVEIEVDSAAKTARTTTSGEPNLALIPAVVKGLEVEAVEGRPEPELQGWYCGGGVRPVPAPCVVYRQFGAPPALIQTVIWPLRNGETAIPQVEALGHPGSGWMHVILPDGRQDIYCAPAREGCWEWEGMAFEGLGLLVRKDAEGTTQVKEVILRYG